MNPVRKKSIIGLIQVLFIIPINLGIAYILALSTMMGSNLSDYAIIILWTIWGICYTVIISFFVWNLFKPLSEKKFQKITPNLFALVILVIAVSSYVYGLLS